MLKEPAYLSLIGAGFFGLGAVFIPVFFIQTYYMFQQRIANAATSNLTFWLIPILLAGSIPGRIIPNVLAASLGGVNVMFFPFVCCSGLAFAWNGVHSEPAIIIYALIYGFFSGGVVAMIPPVIVAVAVDKRHPGTNMGMGQFGSSLGLLMGPPVDGPTGCWGVVIQLWPLPRDPDVYWSMLTYISTPNARGPLSQSWTRIEDDLRI